MHVKLSTTERDAAACRFNIEWCDADLASLITKPILVFYPKVAVFKTNVLICLFRHGFLCRCIWRQVAVTVSVIQARLSGTADIFFRRLAHPSRQWQVAVCDV